MHFFNLDVFILSKKRKHMTTVVNEIQKPLHVSFEKCRPTLWLSFLMFLFAAKFSVDRKFKFKKKTENCATLLRN